MEALLIDMANRLARMEQLMEAHFQEQEQSEWLSPAEFCKQAGITNDALRGLIKKGRIHGDAIRNVGTAKRMRLKYHRVKALNQYLNREPAPDYRKG